MEFFLITRFNVLTGYTTGSIHLDETWLRGRLRLFEKQCAPSVKNQTDQEFTWLIFIDQESPEFLKTELLEIAPKARLVPVSGVFDDSVMVRIFQEIKPGLKGKFISTTRLDSDDSISTNFMEHVKRGVIPEANTWYQFVDGYQMVDGVVLTSRWYSNPFLTRVESLDGPVRGGFAENHAQVENKYNLISLVGAYWMQTIHGGNVSWGSKSRGIPVLGKI